MSPPEPQPPTEAARAGGSSERVPPGTALLTLAVVLVVAAIAIWRIDAPTAAVDPPPSEFSADRALRTLERILSEGIPHPTATPANARVRERIVAEFRELGLEPRVATSLECSSGGTCTEVRNLIASLPPTEPIGGGAENGGSEARGVVLLSHYDSQIAAPGANDDGVGVVVTLETLRALLASGVPRHREILAVVTDAEEEGLIGARAFVARDPAARRSELVLNIESRGSSGPSLMFETGSGSGELVRLYAQQCERPIASSVFASVYERMPNDTDLSVLKRAGFPGLNFAHVRNVEHYHTPRDELRNVSRDTVGHHGQCVLAITRELASNPRFVEGLERSELAYFDLVATVLVRWPLSWTWWLALGAAIGGLAAALRLGPSASYRGALPLLLGSGALVLMLIACVLTGQAIVALLRAASGATAPWTAHPLPASLAVIAASATAGLLLASRLAIVVPPAALWIGVWLPLSASGLAATTLLPEAGPPLLVPSLTAVLSYLLLGAPSNSGRALAHATLAGSVATSLILIPWIPSGLDSLGLAVAPIVTVPIALSLAATLPNWQGLPGGARRAAMLGSAALALVSLSISVILPAYDRDHPRAMSLNLIQHDDGRATWFADASGGGLPDELRAVGFDREAVPRPGLLRGHGAVFSANAGAPRLPAPLVERVTSDRGGAAASEAGRTITLRIRSQRAAERVGLLVPTSLPLEWLEIDGRRTPSLTARWLERSPGFIRYSLASPKPEGSEFRLHIAESEESAASGDGGTFELVAFDRSYGLGGADSSDPNDPNEARDRSASVVAAARPEWAVPIGSGDGVISTRSIEIAR